MVYSSRPRQSGFIVRYNYASQTPISFSVSCGFLKNRVRLRVFGGGELGVIAFP
jgi:hypothetical protein